MIYFLAQSLVLLVLTYYTYTKGKLDLLKGFMCILILNIGFLYVILLRYLSLGIDIDIYSFFNNELIIDVITLIPFIWSFISFWVRLILWRILDIKLILQDFLSIILPEIHIYLLKYNRYEVFAEKIYKFCFIWFMFVIHNSYIYSEKQRQNPISRLIFKVYKHPILISGIIPISFIFEFLLRHGHIHYSFYIMFIFIIFRPIIKALNIIGGEFEWYWLYCKADYVHLRWDKPRYYIEFWNMFPLLRETYGYLPEISDSLQKTLGHIIPVIEQKKRVNRTRAIKLASRIAKRKTSSIFQRHKATYHTWSNVRWVHTEIVRTGFHPITSFFAKHAVDYATLINSSWTHFHTIERLRGKIPYYEIEYRDFKTPFKYGSISQVIEHNLQTNFMPLIPSNVKLFAYNKSIKTDSSNQTQDDIIFDLKETNPPIQDKRVHALDQKATSESNIREPMSKIFSNVTPQGYENIMLNFQKLLIRNSYYTEIDQESINDAISKLINSSSTPHLHYKTWVEVIHLFPNDYIPPIRIPENFSTSNFSDKTRIFYKERESIMEQVSRRLKERNVPCDYDKAIDILSEWSENTK